MWQKKEKARSFGIFFFIIPMTFNSSFFMFDLLAFLYCAVDSSNQLIPSEAYSATKIQIWQISSIFSPISSIFMFGVFVCMYVCMFVIDIRTGCTFCAGYTYLLRPLEASGWLTAVQHAFSTIHSITRRCGCQKESSYNYEKILRTIQ
jgi:hypothetical protein